uniref:Uncharacterized protein n=1 Tax=viral metagenome TaxID=1070528 RepID=A0A6C0EWB0_9ZZZZ
MSNSKEQAPKSSISFEKKMNKNGNPNPKYVDLLEEDKPVAGQKFVCVSFVSPEKIVKQKELFFFEQFLQKWEFSKSMEKFVQFLSFISFKYKLTFDDITKDYQEFIKEEQSTIAKSSLDDEYKTFLDQNEEDLENAFNVKYNFQTSTRGLKVRGVYPTLEEAELRCKMLRELDPNHDVFVGPVGLWMPWDPEAYKTGRVEYIEDELNQLMHEKTKNESFAKTAFEQRVKETKKKAIDENIKLAEKTGASLTQNIDAEGNLVGVGHMNTQEAALNEKESDTISAADIRAELFDGENIIVGKTDNGQSELISGPFAKKKVE